VERIRLKNISVGAVSHIADKQFLMECWIVNLAIQPDCLCAAAHRLPVIACVYFKPGKRINAVFDQSCR